MPDDGHAIPAHRIALTRLLLSDYNLSVERLKFCRGIVEDEVHALFGCDAHPPSSRCA
ncbi:hypothetical protein GGX14DRAFT_574135 [Mycena pura]|uniref:Uncharacterized protein n=1 Tax=Mycena pura TaxID=153505 RepID=A0AAD6UYQ9_9AGAR|nr:hypothetical protein GGX14DRAFT_574135 [Mycena pura]